MKLACEILALCALFGANPLTGQTEAGELIGSWQLRLWVTGPADKSAGPRTASGELELCWLNADLGSAARPVVYSVAYSKTLHGMFGVPTFGPAQALLRSSGMIEFLFNPFVDHGAFRLRGMIHGDSITGEWHRTSFADDGYRGAFRMVRRQ